MASLPPVTQIFEVNAAAFMAGINEMLAGVDRLAVAIDRVAVASDRLGVAADVAATGETRAAAGADEAAVAMDRQAVAAERAGASSESAGGKAAAFGGHMKTALLGIGAATVYAVVSAAKFQQEVTKLYTAAGLTGASMKTVEAEILKVGSATGYTGTQIAEALYHPVSAGLSLKTALAAVSEGAKLAQIHGANLDDTMYALSSVMKAFNQNAGDAGKTAALLNSIVGQGDMRFQDFNQSVKNWAPTAASMGISIQSMGAGLAYLTDRGNSAEVASTRLTMGLSMVTAGSKAANTYLKDLGLTSGDVSLKNQSLAATMNKAGLTTNKIAADLKKPDGLYVALKDLQDAFHKSGLSASQADQVMAKLFGGGRSDKAILSLMSNLDGVKQKYEDIGKGVSHYGDSWAKTQQTVSFQWKKAVADVQNLATSFGVILLPPVEKILSVLGKFFQIIQANPVLRVLAGAIIAVAVGLGIASAAMTVFNAELLASPVTWIIIGVLALAAGLYYLYTHFKIVRDIVADVGHFFRDVWAAAMRAAGAVVQWFVAGPLAFIKQQLAAFAAFWAAHGQQIMTIARAVWRQIAAVIELSWSVASAIVRTGLVILALAWSLAWGLIRDTVRLVWNLIAGIVRVGTQLVLGTVGVLLDLVTGRWGAAWHGLIKLASDALHGAASIVTGVASNFGTLLWDAGASVIRGLIGGIESMFGSLGGVMGQVGNLIKSFLPFSPAKQGPLSGAGDPSYSGRSIASKLAQGLTDGSGDVAAAMHHVAGAAGLLPGGGLAVAGAGGGTGGSGATVIGPIHLTVNGFVGNQQELMQALYYQLQPLILQQNRRNSVNGLSLTHP